MNGTGIDQSISAETVPHAGPICKGCDQPFYYDYIPERHHGSGYCWICFGERNPPMTNDFDITATRTALTKLRKTLGANTPAGRRCSNLLEQLENLGKATDKDQRAKLEKAIGQSVAELSALSKGEL